MEFFNSNKFIIIVLIVLMYMALSGCANKNLPQQGPKQPTTLDSVAKMKSIGALLGCMFAPNDPECERLKSRKTDEKPHKSQEEYDAENNKEWDEMETPTKPVAQE
jgi:hypothetical protein